MQLETSRAWIEIHLKNMEHNLREIEKIIPQKTKIMAVLKADAYGLGAGKIAQYLNKIGIFDFAVATLEEGILLRKEKVEGNILLFSYTPLDFLPLVLEYDLIQTITDFSYAEEIAKQNLPKKLKCHIKIDTGMNRSGEKYNAFSTLTKMYRNEKLEVLGTYSHLCTADSKKKKDKEFTELQISRFHHCIKTLKEEGINIGKTHLQSSYGTLNYQELDYDYVRIGVLLFGIHSASNFYKRTNLDLKPMCYLKTRITSIKTIQKEETVGYGRMFKAKRESKIASISIGYADGYPRNLSGKDALVLVHGKVAKVIGKICMDQMMIDITNIEHVEVGDIVTLIGEEYPIKAEKLAELSQTITPELLSRLGKRLPRIYKE